MKNTNSRDDLIEAKKTLYLAFMYINPELVNDDDTNLLAAISKDADMQAILTKAMEPPRAPSSPD